MTDRPRESSIDDDHSQPIEARLVESDPIASYDGTGQTGFISNALLQNRTAVLAVLFFVTGFLGLPLLWMNKKFSPPERIFWSVIVTLYTLALIGFAVAVCIWSYRRIFP